MSIPKETGRYHPIDEFKHVDQKSSRVIHDRRHVEFPYALSLSEEELVFTRVPVGTESDIREITIKNIGFRPLSMNVIAVGDFAISAPPPSLLVPNETFTIAVAFTPKHEGTCSGGIYIDNEAKGRRFIELKGSAQ